MIFKPSHCIYFFFTLLDYDKVMRLVPFGKLLTVGTIREYFAKQSGADFTEPITAGIFVSIVAWASYQRKEEGHTIIQKEYQLCEGL